MAETTTETPPTSDDPPARGTSRFFGWMRDTAIVRRPGWIGGVCAGIADRLGVDVTIVRGIAVVVAVLGGPALLLYAAAWLLLPDDSDRIHLEQLLRGRFESPLIGIAATLALSMLPVAQGFWSLGSMFWGEPYWGDVIGRAFWTLIVLAGLIGFIIWFARRASRPRGERAPTETAAPAALMTEPVAPAAPAPDASPEDLSEWRERQAAWKAEREQFRRQNASDASTAARARAAEAAERSRERRDAARERARQHRLAHPTLRGAITAIVIGLAIVLGGAAGTLAAGIPDVQGSEVATGLAVSAIVLGLALIVTGAFRRHSAMLGFVAFLASIATIVSAFIPSDREIDITSRSLVFGESIRLAQPAGSIDIYDDTWDNPSSASATKIDIWQGAGDVYIAVPTDLTIRVVIAQRTGSVWQETTETSRAGVLSSSYDELRGSAGDDDTEYDITYGTGAVDATVTLWQGAGEVTIRHDRSTPTTEGDQP